MEFESPAFRQILLDRRPGRGGCNRHAPAAHHRLGHRRVVRSS